MTIWKFRLNPGSTTVSIPLGAKVLTTASQYGEIFIWALVDEDLAHKKDREFIVFGTGEDITTQTSSLEYIGSAFMHGPMGEMVFHVFEVKK